MGNQIDEIQRGEVIDECVGCKAPIYELDKVFRYNDGPIACVDCAPTYADSEREILENLEDAGLGDDDAERLNAALTNVRAQIAAGRGAEKHVW